MNRCLPLGLALALIGLYGATGSAVPTANAQTPALARHLPSQDVLRGRLQVTQAPEVLLDGKADRLSPGSRIRNTSNTLLLSASVTGRTLPVLYRRDTTGLIHEVWVLSPDEVARLDSAEGSSFLAKLLDFLLSPLR